VEVVIRPDAVGVAMLVADAVERLVRSKPDAVLGVATGSSPLGVYRELIRRHHASGLSFRAATVFLLDEYVGLPDGHAQSYRSFIHANFASQVDLPTDAIHVPGAGATGAELDAACARFEADLRAAGGVDLQLLGIGTDGHLGFNEPSSSLASRTRVKTLMAQTRADNARFFESDDDVPHHVVTQGVGTILEARHLVLIATGAGKADPIARAVEGPLTSMCPASALQLHPHATVVIDDAAAASLTLGEYYRDTFARKPAWQRI
jgi:glucosamine-6-phosphate deaminase